MIFAKERGRCMSRSRNTEAQMIGALKQVEAGRAVEDVTRELGVSKHTLYAWKAKYGGMDVSQAQEAKQLRDENSRLRKLVADLERCPKCQARPQRNQQHGSGDSDTVISGPLVLP